MPNIEKIEIEKNYMQQVMEYFKENNLDFNDEKIINDIKYIITHIFKVEVEEMGYHFDPNNPESPDNTFKLKILNDAKMKFRGQYLDYCRMRNGKLEHRVPMIVLNLANLLEGLESTNSKLRLKTCKEMFKTIFHELQHHRQCVMAHSNISSNNVIRFARDFITMRILSKEWYSKDEKTGNYLEYTIENDANAAGYTRLLNVMGEEDEELESRRDMHIGRRNISRYKINTTSADGSKRYASKGYREKDDVTIPVLDDLIKNENYRYILDEFPILKKEYNSDGSKKSAVSLIRNMQNEINQISRRKDLQKTIKEELIIDCKEMYYELIYRQLSDTQIDVLKRNFGKEELTQIFNDMQKYFQDTMKKQIKGSEQLAKARETAIKKYGFVFFSNNNIGTIEIEQNGEKKKLGFEDFMKTIDSELLGQKVIVPTSKEYVEYSVEEYIKEYLFFRIPANGKFKMKDGTTITAKEFVEKKLLNGKRNSEGVLVNPMVEALKEIESDSPWEEHRRNASRLGNYYNQKIYLLRDIVYRLESRERNDLDSQTTCGKKQRGTSISKRMKKKDITVFIEQLKPACELIDVSAFELNDSEEITTPIEDRLMLNDVISSTLRIGIGKKDIADIEKEIQNNESHNHKDIDEK